MVAEYGAQLFSHTFHVVTQKFFLSSPSGEAWPILQTPYCLLDILPTPENNKRFQMGFASRKPSLPFTIGKSRSNSYIPFAEFEAAYSAEHVENCEQETDNVQPAQHSANFSASKRAWNLMSLFPKANAAAAIAWESDSPTELNPTRLDRMPKVQDVGVEGLASRVEPPSEDPRRPTNVSSLFSIGEESMATPSISTTSSTQFSNTSCTKSDIVNAVEAVPSEETISMNRGPIDMKRSYSGIGNPNAGMTESPQASPEDFCLPLVQKSDDTQHRVSFETSKCHNKEVKVQENGPSIKTLTENATLKVDKNAEQEMAELILRRKKLLARKEANKPPSS